MSMVVAGSDLHRSQITFDVLDRESGEVNRGRIPATPAAVGDWAARFPGREVHVAVEAGTGWWFVHQALAGAGAVCHLAEVAETRGAARAQAPGQDRLCRRPLASDAAR